VRLPIPSLCVPPCKSRSPQPKQHTDTGTVTCKGGDDTTVLPKGSNTSSLAALGGANTRLSLSGRLSNIPRGVRTAVEGSMQARVERVS
jgi:hypothetical protein